MATIPNVSWGLGWTNTAARRIAPETAARGAGPSNVTASARPSSATSASHRAASAGAPADPISRRCSAGRRFRTSANARSSGSMPLEAFRDPNVQPGKKYFYSVSAIDERSNQSPRSEEASEQVP
jgi:hypothetical protein